MRQIPAVYLPNHLLFPLGHTARPFSRLFWSLVSPWRSFCRWNVGWNYIGPTAGRTHKHPPTCHPPFSLFSCLQLKGHTPGSGGGRAMRGKKPKNGSQESQPSRNSYTGLKCVSEVNFLCAKPLHSWGCLLQQWACPDTWNNYGIYM